MTSAAMVRQETATAILTKADPALPALKVTGAHEIAIRAGTVFAGRAFTDDTIIARPEGGWAVGADYVVVVVGTDAPMAVKLVTAPVGDVHLGGFHVAPGGNASARGGGDDQPAINPFSCWDLNFRPSCADPRGMTLVELAGGRKFWCDIYLLGTKHLSDGTSKFGAVIADGNECPQRVDGDGNYRRFDYDTARAVMTHHGKGLLSLEEFFAAAFGVTEKSTCDDEPERSALDAARTSKWGVIQATGNMWVWGHDGDPDLPRASLFGGSWLSDGGAGSRCAHVAYYWPDASHDSLGARGRGDHLQLG
ncbi:MAG: hypothetical protein AB7U62_04085 [Pseudolabrys sp.]